MTQKSTYLKKIQLCIFNYVYFSDQFLHYKLFRFFNHNLFLFLILIYCILLYVCALEHVNLLTVLYKYCI